MINPEMQKKMTTPEDPFQKRGLIRYSGNPFGENAREMKRLICAWLNTKKRVERPRRRSIPSILEWPFSSSEF
jgi:hypothetical protein